VDRRLRLPIDEAIYFFSALDLADEQVWTAGEMGPKKVSNGVRYSALPSHGAPEVIALSNKLGNVELAVIAKVSECGIRAPIEPRAYLPRRTAGSWSSTTFAYPMIMQEESCRIINLVALL
jgi:hypothetical protein